MQHARSLSHTRARTHMYHKEWDGALRIKISCLWEEMNSVNACETTYVRNLRGISLVLSSLEALIRNIPSFTFSWDVRCVCVCVCSRSRADTARVVMITERSAQTTWFHVNRKSMSMHTIHACMQIHTHTHTHTHSSLWCPEPVWPSAGMWSEAGNVWAMKACVYAGCSRPPPARGKTDTSTASFALHLSPSPLKASTWSFLTSASPRSRLSRRLPLHFGLLFPPCLFVF